jgi:tRNA(Ile)-lysidine synthase
VSAADPADGAEPLGAAEASELFSGLADAPAILLAVSGGPDSVALLFLAVRWRKARKRGPSLVAATVDHGLRPEAAAEARQVARLARSLGVPHRILRWRGDKPGTGLQEKARTARYSLLADAARRAGATHVLTAHTLDDQAETVLMRLLRGSGPAGLAGMARSTPLDRGDRARLPGDDRRNAAEARPALRLMLFRPLLELSKARLIATVRRAGLGYVEDPSNRDPRFTRVRMRGLLPALAEEGLDARRLAVLARRLRRAEAALEAAVEEAAARGSWDPGGSLQMAAADFNALPDEVALRLLGRAVGQAGDQGPVELGKLEALHAAMGKSRAGARFRRTLAGAMVTLTPEWLTVARAPARRKS